MVLALRGDRLTGRYIDAIAGVTATVVARVRGLKSGKIQRFSADFTTTNDRVAQNFVGVDDQGRPVEEDSEIISGTAGFVVSEAKRGQLYLTYGFGPSINDRSTIAAGYLHKPYGLPMGTFQEPGPGGGEGYIRTVTGTDPAAGAEVSETVPTNAFWRLRMFSAVLVADANAANRVA